jgi:hypothetical protein
VSLAPKVPVAEVEQTPGSENAHSEPGDIVTEALDWAEANAYRFPALVDLIVDCYLSETS